MRIAVGAGNAVREITKGWTKVHQVVHMRDVLVPALRDDIQREVPSLRYWSTEGTPHNAPEEGFLCDEYGVGLVFPTKWTPAPGHETYTMTEPRREHPSRKLLPLEKPYATVSHDESAARGAVVAGLTSGMDYWAGLAVGWIESGLPLDTQLAELLLKIAELRHMPQQLRHRAFALAKRWQKGQRPDSGAVRT